MWTTPSFAQETFQLEHFEPWPSQGLNVLNVATTDVLAHGKWSFGGLAHLVDDPLVVVDSSNQTTQAKLVDYQLRTEVLVGVGLFSSLELGVAMPLVALQSGDDQINLGRAGQKIEGFGLSDIRLTSKWVVLSQEDTQSGFGVALGSTFYVPVGDSDAFSSDGTFRIEPRLIVDWHHSSGFVLGANVAYQLFRSTPNIKSFEGGNAFRYAIMTSIPLGFQGFNVVGTLFGHVSQTTQGVFSGGHPLEAQSALAWKISNMFVAQVGGGVGLNNSIGSPAYRLLCALSYTPSKTLKYDADGDGVLDALDVCPHRAEDRDGFEDEDGCPELDNDNDGIVDTIDQCPHQVEDRDGFKDEDGCPELDNDLDGIVDAMDGCPNKVGPKKTGGCPVVDTDGDGIPDTHDLCVDVPEDHDNFEDRDGCPDLDNDGDGVLDTLDKCPNLSGSRSSHGCPERLKSTD